MRFASASGRPSCLTAFWRQHTASLYTQTFLTISEKRKNLSNNQKKKNPKQQPTFFFIISLDSLVPLAPLCLQGSKKKEKLRSQICIDSRYGRYTQFVDLSHLFRDHLFIAAESCLYVYNVQRVNFFSSLFLLPYHRCIELIGAWSDGKYAN